MIKNLLILLCFGAFLSKAQTYEVMEVEILGTSKETRDLNDIGSNFGPFVFGNTIYFTSNREYDLHNLGENNWKKGGFLNLYQATFKDGDINEDSKIKDVELVSESIKTNNHTGPACLSGTGDTMFFTQVQMLHHKKLGKKHKYRPQLFMAIREGKKWTQIQAMPFNDENYSFGHPCYDSKRQRLYFSSDKPGGIGGKDLYYVDLANGTWTSPKLVEGVNTKENEVFPFIINDYLFFASDKAGGEGGLDLYWKITNQNDEPKPIVGLNTDKDDFGIFVFPGMTRGFYCTTNDQGLDQINFVYLEKKVTVKNELAGMFTYRNINGQASNLKVMVMGEDDNILFETTTQEDGSFVFRNIDYDGAYSIHIASEEEMNLVIFDKDGKPIADLVTDENGAFTYKKLRYAQTGTLKLIPDDMVDFNLKQGHLTGQFIYENIPGEYPNGMKVLLYNEEGEIAFTTFTDEKGNFDFRKLDMSENYILTVPENDEELILLIFDKEGNVVAQLKSNKDGQYVYRKLNPSYSNSLAVIQESEDLFDLESQTISGYFEYNNLPGHYGSGLTVYAYSEDGMLLATTKTDSVGNFRFRNLPMSDNFLFKLDESDLPFQLEGFTLYVFDRYGKKIAQLKRGQNGFFIFQPLGFETTQLTEVQEDSLDIHLNIKTNYEIVTVYFDSNQSNVKSNDLSKLSQLAKLLKENPNLKVEINAYADARNSDEYNLILSGKRGEWVVGYLTKKGIDQNRFIVNAYGETKLVDEENHALNRRAEIRIY